MDILNYIVPSKNFRRGEEYLDILFRTQLKFEKNDGTVSFYKKKDVDLLDVIESKNFLCFRFGDNSNKFVIERNDNIYDIKTKYEEDFNFDFVDNAMYLVVNIFINYAQKNNPTIIGIIGDIEIIATILLRPIIFLIDKIKNNVKFYFLRGTGEYINEELQEFLYNFFASNKIDIDTTNYLFDLYKNADQILQNIFFHSEIYFEVNIKIGIIHVQPNSTKIEFDVFVLNKKNGPDFFGIRKDVKKKIYAISGNKIYVRDIIYNKEYIVYEDIYYYLTRIVRYKAIVRNSMCRSIETIDFLDNNIDVKKLGEKLNINHLLFKKRTKNFDSDELYNLYENFSNYTNTSPDFIINKIKFKNFFGEVGAFIFNSNNTKYDVSNLVGNPTELFNRIDRFEFGLNISIQITWPVGVEFVKKFLDRFYELDTSKQSNLTEIVFSPRKTFFDTYKNYFFDRKNKDALQND